LRKICNQSGTRRRIAEIQQVLGQFLQLYLAHGDAGASQGIAQTLNHRLLAGIVEVELAGSLSPLGSQNILHVLAVDVQLALFLGLGSDLNLVFRAAAGEILYAHLALDLLRLGHGRADLVERRRVGELDRHQDALFKIDAVLEPMLQGDTPKTPPPSAPATR